MKLAVVTTVGWLYKWGYQNVYMECIGSQAVLADRLYVVMSGWENTNVDKLKAAYSNIELIWDERTRYSADEATRRSEHFHNRNLSIGLMTAREAGYDMACCMHANWYVPRECRTGIRAECQRLYDEKDARGCLYRGDQLWNVWFNPNRVVWFINNLSLPSTNHLIPGKVRDKAYRVKTEVASDSKCYAIDVPLEMTEPDFRGIMEWAEYPQANGIGTYQYEWYRDYYTRKFGTKPRSRKPLDETGKILADKSQPDYVSHDILKGLKP